MAEAGVDFQVAAEAASVASEEAALVVAVQGGAGRKHFNFDLSPRYTSSISQ